MSFDTLPPIPDFTPMDVGDALIDKGWAMSQVVTQAIGAELDKLGKLAGIQRCASVSDVDYRNVIQQHMKAPTLEFIRVTFVISPQQKPRFQQIIEEIEDADHGPSQ